MTERISEEQIIGFLREAEAGMPIKDLCNGGFSEGSYYLRPSRFGGIERAPRRAVEGAGGESG